MGVRALRAGPDGQAETSEDLSNRGGMFDGSDDRRVGGDGGLFISMPIRLTPKTPIVVFGHSVDGSTQPPR